MNALSLVIIGLSTLLLGCAKDPRTAAIDEVLPGARYTALDGEILIPKHDFEGGWVTVVFETDNESTTSRAREQDIEQLYLRANESSSFPTNNGSVSYLATGAWFKKDNTGNISPTAFYDDTPSHAVNVIFHLPPTTHFDAATTTTIFNDGFSSASSLAIHLIRTARKISLETNGTTNPITKSLFKFR